MGGKGCFLPQEVTPHLCLLRVSGSVSQWNTSIGEQAVGLGCPHSPLGRNLPALGIGPWPGVHSMVAGGATEVPETQKAPVPSLEVCYVILLFKRGDCIVASQEESCTFFRKKRHITT